MKWLSAFPPSRLRGLNPANPNGHSAENREWTRDIRFDQMAKAFADVLVTACQEVLERPMELPGTIPEYSSKRKIPHLGRTGLVVSCNAKTSGSGVFTPKRYVRISPACHHANSCQMFIEAYMPGATHDANSRDASDSQFKAHGFPVGEEHLGITVGFSALLHSVDFDYNHPSNSEKWTMCASVLEGARRDFDQVFEEFDELAECVERAAASVNPQAPPILDGRVARIRIRLPDQSLDADDWSESGLEEAVRSLASFFASTLMDIAKR